MARRQLFDAGSDCFVDLARQYTLDNGERSIVRESSPLNEPRFDVGVGHGSRNGRAAAVDDNRPHADRFHEHNVDQQVAQRFLVLHDAAAQLDDGHAVAKPANPAQGLDQHVGFLDGVFQRGLPVVSLES